MKIQYTVVYEYEPESDDYMDCVADPEEWALADKECFDDCLEHGKLQAYFNYRDVVSTSIRVIHD